MGKTKKRKTVKSEKPTAPEPAVGPSPRASAPRTISSPFYPATQAPLPLQQELKAAPVPLPTPPPPKAHRKAKVAASWAAKAAAVIIPAVLSGISSYQSSRADQEGGFKTTITAVAELQEATKDLVKQVAYMQGELDAMRGEAARLHGVKALQRRPQPELKTTVTLSKLPADLGEAVKTKGRPPEQQSYSMAAVDADGIFDVNEKAILDAAEKKRAQAIDEMARKRALAAAKKKEDADQKAAAMEKAVPVIVAPEPPSPKVEDPPAPAAPPD